MKIGKYEVLSEIGHGAMGAVYQARDPRLDRLVAIKLIAKSASQDPKHFTLFEKEARAIARLSHPNIVTIFEFDYWEQQPYIVMELLKGTDLDRTVRLADMHLTRKLDLVSQICEGLAHAHEQGIIHRDIKPANIFVTESGIVKITDFGIARLASGTMTTGSLMGTPEFIAPERLSTGLTDQRSDIFSTGVLLYWIVSGIRPFVADDVNAVFFRILNHEPADLGVTGITGQQLFELNRIMRKSIAKNPDERYSTAAAMSVDLRNLQRWIDSGIRPDSGTISDTINLIASTPSAGATASHSAPTVRQEKEVRPVTQIDSTLRVSKSQPFLQPSRRNKLLAAAGMLILIGVMFAGYRSFFANRGEAGKNSALTAGPATRSVQIGIATGKEKLDWMEEYAGRFSKTTDGRGIKITVLPFGSMESMSAVLNGDKRIHVWSPASDIQEELFINKWTERNPQNPFLEHQSLALTPTVILIWENRYQEFIKKYRTLLFSTLAQAMNEKDGWAGIAGKPEWGEFKFGLSDPTKFNSGLAGLLEMSHEYHRTPGLLTAAQIKAKGLVDLMAAYKSRAAGSRYESSDLLDQMIARGPASYDAVFTYESLAIRAIKEAEGRWGKVRVIYPEYNYWMNSPYYVLDAPWCSAAQKDAARMFLRYLYSVNVQKELLNMRVRPANPQAPLRVPGSPFVQSESAGILLDIQNVLDEPSADVVTAILESWEQNPG